MGSMFGGSDDSSSREMIEMQKQEAALARAKEEARQGRLTSGLDMIKNAFHGAPVMGTRTVATPASTSYVTDPATTKYVTGPSSTGSVLDRTRGVRGTTGREGGGTGGGQSAGRYVTTPGQQRAVTTPAGTRSESYDTGERSGGIQNSFFDNFKQGILDYYTPQVEEKRQEAEEQNTYRLANAGSLRSSSANRVAADLYKQNLIKVGEVRSKADAAAADLKSRVAAEEAKAVAQLYATENPEVAANQATAALRNISSEKPDLTPLGAIFDVAAIGGAKYLQGADNAAFSRRVGALPKPGQSQRTV